MTNHQWMRGIGGIGLGLAAGALVGMAVATQDKDVRNTTDKAMKTMRNAAAHLTSSMGR